MARKKGVSVRFLAQECGVSTATVSRVLNNDSSVTPETREKVLSVMARYNYDAPPPPDAKIKKIGAIIPDSYSDYYEALLRNVGIYFRNQGIGTIAMNTESTEGYLTTALETLYDCNVSGIILIGCDYLSVKGHLHGKIPHVWIDCNDSPEETTEICQVQSDQFVAGQQAAQEFLRAGCQSPILLCGCRHTHRSRERVEGFVSEYRKNGFDVPYEQIQFLPEIKPHVTEGQDIVRYLITKGIPFDGIFAMSDGRAIGAYMALQKMGVKVPEEVKIMAFDGIAEANVSVLNITSIQQNVELMTRYAGEALLHLIQRENVESRRILVPTSVLPGQTM